MSALSFRALQGREAAYLGRVLVGYVREIDWSRAARAEWLACLPDGDVGMPIHAWRKATDLDAAREALGRHVADWIGAAGLAAPATSAEREREGVRA